VRPSGGDDGEDVVEPAFERVEVLPKVGDRADLLHVDHVNLGARRDGDDAGVQDLMGNASN
jgi:hypothetical protein